MMRRIRGLTIAFVAILAAAALPSRFLAQPADFYYYAGTRVMLNRSATEYVVLFKPDTAAEPQRLVEGLFPGARLVQSVTNGGRVFHLVAIAPPPSTPTLDRIRATPGVDLVAPVFYQTDTRNRLLLTDEVVVKVKAGTTRAQLDALVVGEGLTVFQAMPGTTDQYVLRVPHAGPDALETSRRLSESGRFDWAEPNFIREFSR